MTPLVSLLLCTVRGSYAYLDHPDWDCLGKIIEDLSNQQEAPPFELVIVDGLYRNGRGDLRPIISEAVGGGVLPFSIRHIPPRRSIWVENRKVAISAYRNTGIAACRGELIVNLDDCCVLPPNFVSTFWDTWKKRDIALALTWPNRGDARQPGRVPAPGMVYGFGSYPREAAFVLNGYDEAFDGGQGLEDADWSTRLFEIGLRQAFVRLPGFDIEPQTKHASTVIDKDRPIVKCCNAAWQESRIRRQSLVANRDWRREELERLIGPCVHLHGEKCGHHGDVHSCAYLDHGFATERDPEAALVLDHPPILDLKEIVKGLL